VAGRAPMTASVGFLARSRTYSHGQELPVGSDRSRVVRITHERT